MKWIRFPRGLGIALVVYFLGLSVFLGYQTSQRFVFLDSAGTAQGVVTALQPRALSMASRRTGPGVPTVPRVSYQVGGVTYELTGERARVNQRLRVGDQVTVRYDPDEPSRAQLAGEGRLSLPIITAGFALCALGVAVLLFLTRHRGRARSTSRPARSGPTSVRS